MIWHFLEPGADWLGNTSLAAWLGQSPLRVALLLDVHLFGITLLLGAIVPLSLRLLGLTMRRREMSEVGRDMMPFATAGLCLVLLTGFVIFTGGAQTYFQGEWFRTKMILLAVAVAFHFTIFRVLVRADRERFRPLYSKLAGAAALILWFSVGIAGRSIAFF
jgi:uncharacterized membrane protein SirB2